MSEVARRPSRESWSAIALNSVPQPRCRLELENTFMRRLPNIRIATKLVIVSIVGVMPMARALATQLHTGSLGHLFHSRNARC